MPTPDPDPVVVESARCSGALARAGWLCTPAPLDDKEIPITRHGDCDLVWRRPPKELSPPEIRAPKALRSDGSFTSTGRCPARASFCSLVPRDDCGKFEPTATSADRRWKNPPCDKPRGLGEAARTRSAYPAPLHHRSARHRRQHLRRGLERRTKVIRRAAAIANEGHDTEC
jgi:hypothetical protein